ncbi:MAG: DUF4115 domain-containing protein [Gammaproteobacteria bacterium]|nr:DUF4115 domain-containing protein [Gammaproteobacteria bacterium]
MNEPPVEEYKVDRSDNKTVSQCLSAAREAMGLSQKEIAKALNLTESFVRFLDEGQFDKLPRPAFVKGYIRSYAKLVQLQGDEMIAIYVADNEEPEPPREFTVENVNSSAGLEWQTGIIGLLLVVLVIAVVWIFSTGEESKPIVTIKSESQAVTEQVDPFVQAIEAEAEPDEIDQDTTAESDADQSVPALTDGIEDQDSTRVVTIVDTSVQELLDGVTDQDQAGAEIIGDASIQESPDEVSDQDQTGTETVIDQSIQEFPDAVEDQELTEELEQEPARDVSIERTESGDFNYINVDAGGFDLLEFTFTGECWVEIEDAAGTEEFYFDLQRDGDILTVYGVQPFKILLGHPSSVELKFNQKEVDLMEYEARDGTARINIGE